MSTCMDHGFHSPTLKLKFWVASSSNNYNPPSGAIPDLFGVPLLAELEIGHRVATSSIPLLTFSRIHGLSSSTLLTFSAE